MHVTDVIQDGELNESMKIVQEKLDYEIQKLKAKYWKDVSAKLTDRLQRKKYTAKACKERFTGLLDGHRTQSDRARLGPRRPCRITCYSYRRSQAYPRRGGRQS